MTDAPKLWKDMTDAEKGELLLAALEGSEIQMSATGSTYWHDVNPKWGRNSAYRVKPKAPKVETHVDYFIYKKGNGLFFCEQEQARITINYTVTDGVVTACDTIIHKVNT